MQLIPFWLLNPFCAPSVQVCVYKLAWPWINTAASYFLAALRSRKQGGKDMITLLTSFTTIRTFCKHLPVAQWVTDIHCVCFLFPLPHPKFSQLIKIFNSLGPEKFPLVEQTFFPSHKQMVSNFAFFWCHYGWGGDNRCKLDPGNGGRNAGKSLNFSYRKILAKKCYAKGTAWEPLCFLA